MGLLLRGVCDWGVELAAVCTCKSSWSGTHFDNVLDWRKAVGGLRRIAVAVVAAFEDLAG